MAGDLNFKITEEHEVGVVQLAQHSNSLEVCGEGKSDYMFTLELMSFINPEMGEYDAILGSN